MIEVNFYLAVFGALEVAPVLIHRLGLLGGTTIEGGLFGPANAQASGFASLIVSVWGQYLLLMTLAACGTNNMLLSLNPTGDCFGSGCGEGPMSELIQLFKAEVVLNMGMMAAGVLKNVATGAAPFGDNLEDSMWELADAFTWMAPWTGAGVVCRIARAKAATCWYSVAQEVIHTVPGVPAALKAPIDGIQVYMEFAQNAANIAFNVMIIAGLLDSATSSVMSMVGFAALSAAQVRAMLGAGQDLMGLVGMPRDAKGEKGE